VPNLLLERLKKRSEFLVVAKAGDKRVTPAFVVQIYTRASEGHFRFGITASRKVGGAVELNRAKRRLRVLVQQILSTQGHPGTDYVLIARTECLTRNFALMEQDMIEALAKLQHRRKNVSHKTI
jgi:ribonuclease P protein component